MERHSTSRKASHGDAGGNAEYSGVERDICIRKEADGKDGMVRVGGGCDWQWCSGAGLGKDGTGIKKSIVVKKKDDDQGVGVVSFWLGVDWFQGSPGKSVESVLVV